MIKQLHRWLLLAMAAILLPATSFAAVETVEIDGINYTIDNDANTASVAPKSEKYTGHISIPASITYSGKSYPVTAIGSRAFDQCTKMTGVDIPSSVTTIEKWAFSLCTGLTGITIPSSVTTIEAEAFTYCTGLESIEIPSSITAIDNHVFFYCTGLKSVTIPSSVTRIGEGAFIQCTSLTSVDIPSSVTFMDYGAFEQCTSLASVNISPSLTVLKSCVFYACSSLTSVDIPPSVTLIEDYAFYACTGLKSVNIPPSVTSIEKRAFCLCTALTSLTIPASVTILEGNVFNSCKLQPLSFQAPENIKTWYLSILNGLDEESYILVPDQAGADLVSKHTSVEVRIQSATDIGGVEAGASTPAVEGYYGLGGSKLQQPQRGVNIIRRTDGSARKVIGK